MRKLEQMDWWDDLVAKKDEFSLRELAEMFGATPGAINNALKRNGIERSAAPPGPRSRRGRPPAPRRESAPTRARGARASTTAKLDPFEDQLGQISDAKIAELAGVSVQTVARYRRSKGISPSRGRRSVEAAPAAPSEPVEISADTPIAEPRTRKGRSKIEPYIHLLGQIPDAEVADLAGVSANAVRNYRARRDIPSPSAVARSRRSGEPAEAAPAETAPAETAPAETAAGAAAPAAPSRGGLSLAYRIQLGDRVVIVISEDIIQAAQQASAAGGTVRSIELIGELLG